MICGATFATEDAMVAVVGDKVITASSLQQTVRVYKKLMDPSVLKNMDDQTLRSQVLQVMVDVQIQKNLAKRAGITLSKEEKRSVRNRLAKQQDKTLVDLKDAIRRSGLNPEHYFSHFEDQALLQKTHQLLVGPQVRVSQSDVTKLKAEMDASQTEYFVEDIVFEKISTPESLADSKKQADSLANSWPKSAYNKWNVPKGSRMIQFQWKKLAELPEVFQAHVAQLSQGQCPKPIITESGVHVLKLIKKRHASGGALPTDSQLKEYAFNMKLQKELASWLRDIKSQTYVYIA